MHRSYADWSAAPLPRSKGRPVIHPWANEPDPSEPLQRRVRRWKIDRYLTGQHCVLFPGAHWDLTDDKERAEAVAWIEALMDGVG